MENLIAKLSHVETRKQKGDGENKKQVESDELKQVEWTP